MRAVTTPPPTQKALLAALVLALVAAIGMSLMQGDDGPALGDDPAAATATRTGAAEAADGGFRRSDADGPTEASASGAAGSERAAALGDDMGSGRPLPEDARWIELLVVDKATGAPQPDALVHWYDDTAYEFASRNLDGDDENDNWNEALQTLFRYGERVAGAAGWRTRADADGKARVTLGKEWTNVVVTHGGLYGELNLRDNSVPPAGGYRVELGEIEAAFHRLDGAREAAAVALPDAEAGVSICLFYSWPAEAGAPPSSLKLRQHAARHLPAYMIPDRFQRVEAMPMTSTDKTDYQSLLQLAQAP